MKKPVQTQIVAPFLRGFVTGTFVATTGYFYYQMYHAYKQKNNDKPRSEDEIRRRRCTEILRYGQPDIGTGLRYYSNHVLVYDQQKRIPRWVAEHITPAALEGDANRAQSKFKPDPGVDVKFTAQNADYWKSGWSRGHMAPAGDNKHNQEAMNESFYLSNIVPQNYENNAGFWNRLEMYCRDLTKKYPSVYVLSGPLMMPTVEENGSKYVKYQVIGENNVAVPTHLFKVILVEDQYQTPQGIGAFIVPNKPLGFEHDLRGFQVPIEEFQRISGINGIVSKLKLEHSKDLCTVEDCKLMDKPEFELYIIGRKLKNAKTLERVEKVWSELVEKGLQPDRYVLNMYRTKCDQFMSENNGQNETS